jgi:hypothetical protein
MPGAKRPCEREDDVRLSRAGAAARGVLTATVWVANASLATPDPQDAQKRAESINSAPQDGQ